MQSIDMDFRIRRFEREDLDEILSCYKGAAGRTISNVEWEWQYLKNPARLGTEPMAVTETKKTREIVGFVFSTPWNLRYGDKTYYATIGSDAYVKPEHRGKGLYNKMIDFMLPSNHFNEGEIRFSFYNEILKGRSRNSPKGFVTSVSLYFMNPKKVVGSVFSNKLPKTILPPIYKIKKTAQTEKNMKNAEFKEGDIHSISKIYEKWLEKNKYIHTYRNPKYLNWRFKEYPNGRHEYFLVKSEAEELGCFIINVDERFAQYPLKTAIISDYILLNDDPTLFESSVARLLSVNTDKDLIMARAFATPEYQKRLRDLGFMDTMYFPLNQWMRPGFMGVRVYNPELVSATHRASWYLTQSDCF